MFCEVMLTVLLKLRRDIIAFKSLLMLCIRYLPQQRAEETQWEYKLQLLSVSFFFCSLMQNAFAK